MASLSHASVGVVIFMGVFLVRSSYGLFVLPSIQHNTPGTKATSRESYHPSQSRRRLSWKTCFSGGLSSGKSFSIRRMSPLSEEDNRQDDDEDSILSTENDNNNDDGNNENLNQQWKDFQKVQTLLRQSDLFQPEAVLPQYYDEDDDNGTTVAVGIFFLMAVLCLGGIYWNMNHHHHLMATSLSTKAPTGMFESDVLNIDDDDVDSAKGRFQALTGGVWF